MGVFELWDWIRNILQSAAPVVITFAVFYIGTLLIKGYVSFVTMIKYIFEKPGRVVFIVLLFLVVMYFWESFQANLGW